MIIVDILELELFQALDQILDLRHFGILYISLEVFHELFELLVLVHDHVLHVTELDLLLNSLLHGGDLVTNLLALLNCVFL